MLECLWAQALAFQSSLLDICARCSGDLGGLASGYLISAFAVDVGRAAHSDFYFSVLSDSPSAQSHAPNI